MIAAVKSKGRITLPVEAQKKLKLRPGTKLHFIVIDEERLEVMPVKEKVTRLKGMAPKHAFHLSLEDMEKAIADGMLS